jgi:putative membrane protein
MKSLFILSSSLTAFLSGAANAFAQQGGYGGGGPDWTHPMMWGGGWFGGPIMMLFWVGVVVLAIYVISRAFRGRTDSPAAGSKADSAMEELKRRYAAGEIDKETFREMKGELNAS